MPLRDILNVSLLRTLYYSLRFKGRIIIFRGTRIWLQRGARIRVAPGGHLILGRQLSGIRCTVRIDRNGSLNIGGRVSISQGNLVRIFDDATLEIGDGTFIHVNSSIFCKERIVIGSRCAISWHVNILDGNMHELIIGEVAWPKTMPVDIGDNVWIGTNVTLVGASIGDGAVIGANTMVTTAVPAKALVTGNPAQIAVNDISWVF